VAFFTCTVKFHYREDFQKLKSRKQTPEIAAGNAAAAAAAAFCPKKKRKNKEKKTRDSARLCGCGGGILPCLRFRV